MDPFATRVWCPQLVQSYLSVYCYTGGNMKKMPHGGHGPGEEKVTLLGM